MNENQKSKSLMTLVEERVRKWELTPADERKHSRVPNIAISREEGTPADQVARRLSEACHMHLYDGELLRRIAADAHVSERMLQSLDERGESFLADLFQKFLGPYGFTSDEYTEDLIKTIGTIDWQGGGIIIGRGAAHILRPEVNLRVRFVAPLEYRIQHYMHDRALTERDARREIERKDEALRTFVHKAFNVDDDDPHRYDLVVNFQDVDVGEAAALLDLGLRAKSSRAEDDGHRSAAKEALGCEASTA